MKHIDYNPPADLLSRIQTKTVITIGDKLAALTAMEHAWKLSSSGTNAKTIEAIRSDIRTAGPRRQIEARLVTLVAEALRAGADPSYTPENPEIAKLIAQARDKAAGQGG